LEKAWPEIGVKMVKEETNDTKVKQLDAYEIRVGDTVIDVKIYQHPDDFVPTYTSSVLNVSKTTALILEKIREEFVSKITLPKAEIVDITGIETIKSKFKKEITRLIKKYFPTVDERTSNLLIEYIIRQNIGLGDVELLLKDPNLEEVVVNSSKEPVYVYHKKFGWLKTNIYMPNEEKTRHYATMIARDVGKEITTLNPLLDAHLLTGDRVNATLMPISDRGNTITIRKFAVKPWTITDFLRLKTIDYDAAAFLWLAIQHELSVLVAGGTGSGKTSMLNVAANFIPPNQRVISIEDTRELTLPKSLHWVPMATRLPNPEGKGGVSMLDLVVNSLRMRPDRIIVGEIRRQKEAEVLFEAMHTGHSVYGTIHANNAEETITRLTTPPINVPKAVLPALSLILVQNRNRRTNLRRTLQFAEITPGGDPRVLMQLDPRTDRIKKLRESITAFETLNLYTGMTRQEMKSDLNEKIRILQWLVKRNITDVHEVGMIFAKYYTGRL